MGPIVVVHGAWSAAWSWSRMRPLLAAHGVDLVTPTLTGLGERSHLASPAIDLDLHIEDIAAVLACEDLRDVVLLGHSYGGMVATGVAARLPERIGRLVYLDAFVPEDGQCVFDLLPAEVSERMRRAAAEEGGGWRIPPNPLPPDMSEADRAWILPRRGMQPLATHMQPIPLPESVAVPPRAYIYCRKAAPGDVFRPFAERARGEAGWDYREIEASHSPQVTAPEALTRLLLSML